MKSESKIFVRSVRGWRLPAVTVVLAGVIALGQTPLPNGSVSGKVVQAANQSPMQGVLVLISGVGQDTTDANGRFTISNVRPGTFSITALRTGMAPPLGETFSGLLAMGPGEYVTDIRLQLAPFGVISGEIFDENNDPLPGVSVSALVESYVRGRRVLRLPTSGMTGVSDATTTTNDRGEYRLQVPPGIYYLAADYRRRGTPEIFADAVDVPAGMTRTYYPGTRTSETAAFVRVPGGGETPGVDFTVNTRASDGVTVSGTIEGLGSPDEERPPRRYQLISHSYLSWDGPEIINVADSGRQSDNTFQIRGVPPGVYDLVVRDTMADGYKGRGSAPIDVREEDLTDVHIIMRADQRFTGRVATEEGNSPLDLASLVVRYGTGGYVSPASNGNFEIPDVPDTTVPLFIENLPPDAYVVDMRQGGRSLLESARTLNGPELDGQVLPSPLTITVSINGARIDGIVENSGFVSVAGATVVLVPPDFRRFVPSYYKSAVVGGTGNFTLQGIAPGTYQLYAWDNAPDSAWMNPAFLARFEGQGQTISLRAASRLTARLRLLSVSR